MRFRPEWRAAPQAHFAIGVTSSGQGFVPLRFAERTYRVYDNANLSIYSAQTCNAKCPFCVEELRPLSRGTALGEQKRIESDDAVYFAKLEQTLQAVRRLRPSISMTGGEISKDPRLPEILRLLVKHETRKRVMTTNGSGLLETRDGSLVIDHVLRGGLSHLNLSRAHPNQATNQRLMRFDVLHENAELEQLLSRARRPGGPRVRLSCVLVRGGIDSFEGVLAYLEWAASLGVDNVIFRQLMQYDRSTYRDNVITRFNDAASIDMHPILERLRPSTEAPAAPRFELTRQVLGYYYYVEVYRFAGPRGPMDVCFEGANLATLEARKQRPGDEDVVHELIFHPNARLCSTWQPWDGVLL